MGGIDAASGRLAELLYGKAMAQVVPVSNCEIAEAAKILENTYRSVNIALVNELKMLFMRIGIDVWEVIDAARTKPFGFQAFYPGPGLGGRSMAAGNRTVKTLIRVQPLFIIASAILPRFARRSGPRL